MINKYGQYDRVKSSQKKLNGIAGTSALLVIMALVFIFGKLYFSMGRTVETEAIIIPEQGITVNADDSGFTIKGSTKSKTLAFVSHKYKIKDGNLYLRLRCALALKKKTNEFAITIKDDNFSSVERIYLQGKSKDDVRLLWER